MAAHSSPPSSFQTQHSFSRDDSHSEAKVMAGKLPPQVMLAADNKAHACSIAEAQEQGSLLRLTPHSHHQHLSHLEAPLKPESLLLAKTHSGFSGLKGAGPALKAAWAGANSVSGHPG